MSINKTVREFLTFQELIQYGDFIKQVQTQQKIRPDPKLFKKIPPKQFASLVQTKLDKTLV